MKITEIRWTDDRISHIARHQVTVEQVEEAVFDDPNRIVKRVKKATRDPDQNIYLLLGQTEAGRYLAFIFIYEGHGVVYPVTARDMKQGERRLYLASE